MSDIAKDVKLSLKVMINKEKNKVLFAEADTHFVNVLLSFLTFPLGRIAKLLEKHYPEKSPVFGSITSLYKSLANLDDAHFSTPAAKLMLLDPRGSFDSICRNLKLDISESTPTKYFISKSCECSLKNVCMYYGGTSSSRCFCGRTFDKETFVSVSEDSGPFTIKNASFIILEDLRMEPYSIGMFQTLSYLGVKGAQGAELMNVTLGTNEIMDLLKCCILSETPLTDLILNKGEITTYCAKPEPPFFFNQILKEEISISNSKKIILKVIVQKSTQKLLFAQACEYFVELLFSFLIIPVGGVESLLETNTCLKNLDNLHKTISGVSLDKYFDSVYAKLRLMNPNIPPFFKPNKTFLPLNEETRQRIYFVGNNKFSHKHSVGKDENYTYTFLNSPKGYENYVMGPATFMVTDDLTVAPFSISAVFSVLNLLNIPLFDVDELEVRIGLQECLRILKASPTSTSALTDGLISHLQRKQPKQEH